MCIQFNRCVKYRRKVLIDDIEKTLKELLIEISNENNIKIIEMETNLDHIHILIECSPQHFIGENNKKN